MTDNLFPFMFWALGDGLAGSGPGAAMASTCWRAARRATTSIPAQTGAFSRPRRSRKNSGANSATLSASNLSTVGTIASPAAVARVGAIVKDKTSSYWRERIAGRDCCCSIVATLREALDNPHFAARGLMARRLVNERGDQLPALPVAIDGVFRASVDTPLSAPALGAHNAEFGANDR